MLVSALWLTSCMTKTETMSIPFPQEPENPVVLEKLVGTWKSADGRSFERWTKADGKYYSSAYILEGKDTVFMEKANVFKESGHWIFANTVKGQNEGREVRFTSGEVSENAIQFLNPEHDFPTEIHYRLADENTVNAFIAGKNKKGEMDTIPFNYTRLKQ